jgi:predicted MPP superfamily phosphohydrolase
MKRRALLLSLFPVTAAAYNRFHNIEPTWFQLTRTRIPFPISGPRRLLHLSDLHISDGMTASDLARGLEAGLAQRPDFICITGDFVTTTTGFDRPGLEGLLRRAAGAAPTYAVLGNHDGGEWLGRRRGSPSTRLMADLVSGTGVRLLHNDSATEQGITLAGIADLSSGEFDPARAFVNVPPHAPTIVLCHNPDGKGRLRRYAWQLMLSGHTHGGQARVPLVSRLWTPVHDKRYIAGHYRWDRRHLFITRGLGSPKHVRAFCRPEVSILELTPHT